MFANNNLFSVLLLMLSLSMVFSTTTLVQRKNTSGRIIADQWFFSKVYDYARLSNGGIPICRDLGDTGTSNIALSGGVDITSRTFTKVPLYTTIIHTPNLAFLTVTLNVPNSGAVDPSGLNHNGGDGRLLLKLDGKVIGEFMSALSTDELSFARYNVILKGTKIDVKAGRHVITVEGVVGEVIIDFVFPSCNTEAIEITLQPTIKGHLELEGILGEERDDDIVHLIPKNEY